MQITIVQAEIEQAITDFIHRQINVREGMLIQIDLKATRGDAGFQAVIDIVDPNTALASTSIPAHKQDRVEPEPAQPIAVPAQEPSPAASPEGEPEPARVRTRVVRAVRQAPVEKSVEKSTEKPLGKPVEKVVEPEATYSDAEVPDVSSEPEGQAVVPVEANHDPYQEASQPVTEDPPAPVPAKPRQSLFSNLPRPVNG